MAIVPPARPLGSAAPVSATAPILGRAPRISAAPVPQSTIGAYDPTGGATLTLTGRSTANPSETGSHPGTGTGLSGGDCLANAGNVLPGCPTENGPTR